MKLAKAENPTACRCYKPDAHKAMRKLHETTLRHVDAFVERHENELDRDLDDIESTFPTNGGEFLVGVVEDRIAAMGAPRRTDGEIKRMRVDPALQRCGRGRMMLEALEGRAIELGYTKLHLDTATHGSAARRLYETHGYREIRQGLVGPLESIFYEKSIVA